MSRKEWMAVLLAVIVAGLWVHPYRAQQASRYALTAALADRGTLVLDDYEQVLGVDRAVRDGHTYSDKAPGQPVLAVPFYLAYRAVGGEAADVLRIDRNLGLWWVTLWSSAIPLGALSVLMSRYLRRKEMVEAAWPVSLAVTYSTLLLPFGALLFGHVLAALCSFAMLYLVDRTEVSWGGLVGAGLVGGLGVIVEYATVVAVLSVAILAHALHGWRGAWVTAGGIPMAAALMVYNALAFGGPFVYSYQFTAFDAAVTDARPVLSEFSSFAADNLLALVAEPRGFLLATPLVVVGMVGMVWLLAEDWRLGLTLSVILGGFLVVVASWANPWGGDSPGPRYFVPALPFLCLPLALVWHRWRALVAGTSAVGAITMFLATATEPLVGPDGEGGIGLWARLFGGGDVAPTVFGQSRWIALGIGLIGSTVVVAILRMREGVAVEALDSGLVTARSRDQRR